MIRPHTDHHDLACGYLSRVECSCPDVVAQDTFSIHISHIEDDHSQDLSRVSHIDALANAPIKHTIHCNASQCVDLLSLSLESHGEGFLSSTRLLN